MTTEQKQYSSWGDYLKSYRTDHGSQSLSTLQQTQPSQRFSRTIPALGSIADSHHKHFCCGSDTPHAINADDGSLQRSQWHGWGDTSLLKQEGYEGVPHPRGEPLAPPLATTTRQGTTTTTTTSTSPRCWGTSLLMAAGDYDVGAQGSDSWIGHPLIQPGKGKRAVTAPVDPRGRHGLRDVLAHAATGTPSDDAWCGHPLIVPAKGKGVAPSPASLRGRRDLFVVMQQAPPDQTASATASGRQDPYADAWIGNRYMPVGTGKKHIRVASAARNPLVTARDSSSSGGGGGCGEQDVRPTGRKRVEEPGSGPTRLGMAQTLRQEEPLPPAVVVPPLAPPGKKPLPERLPGAHPTAGSVYAAMTFKELEEEEVTRYRDHWDDSGKVNRVKAVPPARRPPGEGVNLLAWQPNRQGYYLRKGGLAQLHGVHPTPSTGGTGVLSTLVRSGGLDSAGVSRALSSRPAWGGGGAVKQPRAATAAAGSGDAGNRGSRSSK